MGEGTPSQTAYYHEKMASWSVSRKAVDDAIETLKSTRRVERAARKEFEAVVDEYGEFATID